MVKQIAWVQRYSSISLAEIKQMSTWEWKAYCEEIQRILNAESGKNGD